MPAPRRGRDMIDEICLVLRLSRLAYYAPGQ